MQLRASWLAALLLAMGVWLAPNALAGERLTAAGHRVRWDGGLDAVGTRVHELLPRIQHEVAESIGFQFPGGPAEVVVISGLERMRRTAGVGVPEWAAGVCVGSRSRIVLRADRLRERGIASALITTLRHEWVHLAWARRAGVYARRLPLWAEEGLAEEIGGGFTLDGGQKLDFAAAWGGLIPLSEIAAHWPAEANRAALAYRQGRSWIRFFLRERGWDPLQRILGDLADGKGTSESLAAGPPFDELVYEHTGATLSDWNVRWETWLKETADPLFFLLLRDFTGTIFFLIAVIALVAFVFLRRRRKRQIAELPDDPYPEGAPTGADGV